MARPDRPVNWIGQGACPDGLGQMAQFCGSCDGHTMDTRWTLDGHSMDTTMDTTMDTMKTHEFVRFHCRNGFPPYMYSLAAKATSYDLYVFS